MSRVLDRTMKSVYQQYASLGLLGSKFKPSTRSYTNLNVRLYGEADLLFRGYPIMRVGASSPRRGTLLP
jgi:hypothetical protein